MLNHHHQKTGFGPSKPRNPLGGKTRQHPATLTEKAEREQNGTEPSKSSLHTHIQYGKSLHKHGCKLSLPTVYSVIIVSIALIRSSAPNLVVFCIMKIKA